MLPMPSGAVVGFLDTEGFSASDRTADYDAKIFAISALLSSHLLYNSVRIIDTASIECVCHCLPPSLPAPFFLPPSQPAPFFRPRLRRVCHRRSDAAGYKPHIRWRGRGSGSFLFLLLLHLTEPPTPPDALGFALPHPYQPTPPHRPGSLVSHVAAAVTAAVQVPGAAGTARAAVPGQGGVCGGRAAHRVRPHGTTGIPTAHVGGGELLPRHGSR
jgi:hypothetical protein